MKNEVDERKVHNMHSTTNTICTTLGGQGCKYYWLRVQEFKGKKRHSTYELCFCDTPETRLKTNQKNNTKVG